MEDDKKQSPAALRGLCGTRPHTPAQLAPPQDSSGEIITGATPFNFQPICCFHLQAYYLRAGSEMICHCRHSDTVGPAVPHANPKMAGKPFNPLVEFLNSELFRFNRFSSVEK